MINNYTITAPIPDDVEFVEFDYTEPAFGITVTYRMPRRAIDALNAGDSLHFDHIIHGLTRSDVAQTSAVRPCPECGGIGLDAVDENPCPRCNGSGVLPSR